jgi:hypothetical protein
MAKIYCEEASIKRCEQGWRSGRGGAGIVVEVSDVTAWPVSDVIEDEGLDEVLSSVSGADVVKVFRDYGDLGPLLDAIGKEACMAHFGLVEKP